MISNFFSILNTAVGLHCGLRICCHLFAVLGLWYYGFQWTGLAIFTSVYVVSMLSITVGYHRFFSHKAFETSRLIQFVIGFFGCCQLQGGPIAWSAIHRHHHRFSDKEEDIHSPIHGFYQSHMGWLLKPKTYELAFKPLKDLQCYPELVWLDRLNFVPAILFLCVLWGTGFIYHRYVPGSVIDGFYVLFWGGFFRLVIVWHATWSVNSVCHLWGAQPFNSTDQSRNNFWVATITMGEGWHNNHHENPSSARAGLRWWEWDPSYYLIFILEFLGLAKNVRRPKRSNF